MKAISLWQPWASLLVHGAKRIVTRSWAYKGAVPCILAVHASKKWSVELRDVARRWPFAASLIDARALGWRTPHGHYDDSAPPLGCVLGLVRLVECVPTSRTSLLGQLSDIERAFGDFAAGRFGWLCDRFHALSEPIPAKGSLGVWNWQAPPGVQAVAEELMS